MVLILCVGVFILADAACQQPDLHPSGEWPGNDGHRPVLAGYAGCAGRVARPGEGSVILGVTGGIGSGKSSVSRLLASYCLATLVDMDHCCRSLLDQGQPGWQVLHAAFGTGYERPDGAIDRPCLRAALFADAGRESGSECRVTVRQFWRSS